MIHTVQECIRHLWFQGEIISFDGIVSDSKPGKALDNNIRI